MPKTVKFNLKGKANTIVVGNINKLRESVASMFNEPIQVSDDFKEPSIDWSRIKLMVLIDRTCTASLKSRWETAAKDNDIPVIAGDDKSNIMKRIEQRFEVVSEEPETPDAATANQNQSHDTVSATPPAEPESQLALPTGLSGLLEEARKLEQAKEEAEAMAFKAMERADALQTAHDELQDKLAAAQAKINALEMIAPDELEEAVEERLEAAVEARIKDLKKQLSGANGALQEKERLLRKADERVEKAREEVAKAREEADRFKEEMGKVKADKLKQLDRRGQLLMAMHLFAHIIPLAEEGEDDDLLEEFEKAVRILFEHNKIQQGATHFLNCFGNLVRGFKMPYKVKKR